MSSPRHPPSEPTEDWVGPNRGLSGQLRNVASRPIEVLIADAIFVSAIHSLRPLFPGSEAVIAVFFGLIRGLAFASTLGQLGLGLWERVGSILAFNRWYRNYAVDRRRCDHALTRVHEPHASILYFQDWRRDVCGFCIHGLDL
jgi:hypothetical protein